LRVAESDRGERSSRLPELALVFAQLRDLLAAEDSPVVSEEDEHGGTLLPQRAEANLHTSRFGQHDIRELRTDRSGHALIIEDRPSDSVSGDKGNAHERGVLESNET